MGGAKTRRSRHFSGIGVARARDGDVIAMKQLWLTTLLLGAFVLVGATARSLSHVATSSLFVANAGKARAHENADTRPAKTQFAMTGEDYIFLDGFEDTSLPAPPADVSNRFADDLAAAALGQKLFFDPRFSGRLLDGDDDGSSVTLGRKGESGKVSCAGCHIPESGFLDSRSRGESISLAAGWGRRHAPSLLDVGQDKLLMWDGRSDAMYNQIFGPLESPVEMNTSRLYVAEQIPIYYRGEYEALFGPLPAFDDPSLFPQITSAMTGCQPASVDPTALCTGTEHGMPGDNAEYDHLSAADQDAVTRAVVNLGKAIGAYERRLTCGPGRYDAWTRGETGALTPSEQRGAQIFAGKGQCMQCHSGPYFSDQAFHNVGLMADTVAVVFIDSNDAGASAGLAAALNDPLNTKGAYSDGDDQRLPADANPRMLGAFKTPMLRCVSRRPTYMHTGQMSSLSAVVAFFSAGGNPYGYLGANELNPLNLSSEEQADLVAFLQTLDGPGPSPTLLQ